MSPAYPHAQNRSPAQQSGGFGNRPVPPPIDMSNIKFGEGIANAKLFDEFAQCMAQAIVEDGHWDLKKEGWKRNNSLSKNKSTQLRKFYDELVMWHDKVFLARDVDGKASREVRQREYDNLAPFIKMLCAKVTYAKGREHVSEGFESLFSKVIRAIDGPETLKQGKLFMEAFMGFYKAEEKDR